MDKKLKSISGTLFSIKDKILDSFPVNYISPKDIAGPKIYKIIDVVYNKPFGDDTKVEIVIVVEGESGEYFNAKKKITFAFSENDRIAQSISPSNFRLSNKVKNDAPPKKMYPSDFIYRQHGVSIVEVDYTPPKIHQKHVVVKLIIKLNDLNSVTEIPLSIEFAKTFEQKVLEEVNESDFEIETMEDDDNNIFIKSEKYTGVHDIKIIQSKIETEVKNKRAMVELEVKFGTKVKWISFSIIHNISKKVIRLNHYLSLVKVDPKFLKECSPIQPDPSSIIFPIELQLVSMFFTPPKTVNTKEASMDLLFKYRGETGRLTLKFRFNNSVKEFVENLKNTMTGQDFEYVTKSEQLAPPHDISVNNFKTSLKDLIIKSITFDPNQVEVTDSSIKVIINLFYRGLEFTIPKDISFQYSRAQLIISSKLKEAINERAIQLPDDFSDVEFIKKIYENDRTVPKKYLEDFYIIPPYSFKVGEVKIESFNIDSRKVKYMLVIVETVKSKTIKSKLFKSIILPESYVESKLMSWTANDILLNKDSLNQYPPDNIDLSIFKEHPLFKIISVAYPRPQENENTATISFTIAAGRRSNIINKVVKFPFSQKEYQELMWDEEDKKTIQSFDPSVVNLHVNILGEPVENVFESQVTGIPQGIDYSVNYEKAPFGKAVSELSITVYKGKYKKTFKQMLIFGSARTKAGSDLQKTHTISVSTLGVGKQKIK